MAHSIAVGYMLAAWLSGSELVFINEVTLRRAGLVLGRVIVLAPVHHLDI